MKTINIICVVSIISMFLCSCDNGNEDLASDFTIKGCIVTAPANMPLPGILVRVTNDNYTLASTSSNADGSFILAIDKAQLDNSYFLLLYDPQMDITKKIEIKSIGMLEYNLGNITLYDSKNPYGLPSFQYDGYTYLVHPILQHQYKYDDAVLVCDGLEQFGYKSWNLPTPYELQFYFSNLPQDELKIYPEGDYGTSDINYLVHLAEILRGNYIVGDYYSVIQKDYSKSTPKYIIPFTRYK